VRVTVGSGTQGQLAVVPDPQGTAPGRGAHLHPTVACYELAVRRKAFGRALRISGGQAQGQLDSAAVGEYVARHDPILIEPTEDREEGWSSSS
jgi:predicted RNA-binding protein YlxR (DUF448 family)